MIPIAETRFLTDRSSMVEGGGRHVGEEGNREGQASYGDPYMSP